MRTVAPLLCAVVLLGGCESGGSLTAPSPLSVPAVSGASQTSAQMHKLTGVVNAAGAPVAGVEISELQTVYGDDCFDPKELSATTTDGAGAYDLPNVKDSSSSMWASWVRAYKPGYFTEFQRPRVANDMRLDFVLRAWTFIPVGQTVRGTVTTADLRCHGNSYGVPGHCHRFALAIAATGTLDVTLTWLNNRPDVVLDVVGPGGRPCALFSWPGGTRHRLSIPVGSGSTYEVRVVDDGLASPLNYELTTTLR